MEKTMKRYGVNHRFCTSYHPQTSGQVENTNRALKRIMEKTVKDNPVIWSRKLDDALLAFRTAFKTPTEDVNPFGGGNPLLTKETESEPIIWDIGDEEEEYPFVNEYPSFKKEPIMFVEDESCPVYDTDNEKEESMPVYDN
ncbi:reverse transcriptase domain-containing protein [Tanacetum coccineum]